MAQAFFVVGRQDFGKSGTLSALTGGLHKTTLIAGRKFLIKRMSNDDKPKGWKEFIKARNPDNTPYVIVATCPKEDAVPLLLEMRRRGFELFFWIIRHRSDNNGDSLTPEEEALFRDIGTVAFCERRAERPERAAQFRQFVESNLR
jgi:hypothetical protein